MIIMLPGRDGDEYLNTDHIVQIYKTMKDKVTFVESRVLLSNGNVVLVPELPEDILAYFDYKREKGTSKMSFEEFVEKVLKPPHLS